MPVRGQVYIGVVIALGIFIILSQVVISLAFSSYDLISFTRARTTAQHLANEKIEEIRNLAFIDIGTIGGIPSGILIQDENQTRNGLSYNIKTSVVFIDDPFDSLAPADLLPTDYKRVRVDVSWGGIAASGGSTITLISDIAPRGIETTAGGGTLSILVFDAFGLPVPQADVHVVASTVNPAIDLNLQTGSNGRVLLPGALTCNSCYEITVTKSGYSSERTYSTTEVANPNKPHQTIIESQVTEISFAIDFWASLAVSSVDDRDNNFSPLPNQIINLRGNKIIGTDSLDQAVYKFDQDVVTDSSGNLSIDEIEWDTYNVSLPSDTTKDIAGTNPLSPIQVLPQDNVNLLVALANQSTNSLLTVFTDSAQSPMASVSATLTNGLGFDETTLSASDSADPDFGQVFFKALQSGAYTLTATVSGFLDFTGPINVAGYTREEIIMNPE